MKDGSFSGSNSQVVARERNRKWRKGNTGSDDLREGEERSNILALQVTIACPFTSSIFVFRSPVRFSSTTLPRVCTIVFRRFPVDPDKPAPSKATVSEKYR